MTAIPGLASVITGMAIMVSAAGACGQQTEQLSLPNVTVTAPAAPSSRPTCTIPARPTRETLIVVDMS